MIIKKRLFAVVLTLLFGFLAVKLVTAQQPTPSDDRVNAIARQLYCPICENTPLDVCPTTACAQWRELIRQKLVNGWNEQQIKDYFVQQYGARVISTRNWLVYLIPFFAILIGGYILYRVFHSWRQPTPAVNLSPSPDEPPGTLNPAQDEYIQKMEDQVRKQ
jgi:cytochrome c-type biogenesis protein CcmH